jgi:aspartyl-tRNA(Asn)/glutamyl-tRNA(Gln) amidotransferase subunit A
MWDDVRRLTLREVASAISARKLSSREATQGCLDGFARHGGTLACVAGLDEEAALSAAAVADEELAAGRIRGPLHGVPLAHKDMFYRAGRVSGCGSRIRADFVASCTATALQRLDSAGALDIARLSMVEFALGPTGHNEVTGTARNPWHLDHITGGSSSGPAAAVSARLVYGALGSDTGGSIRVPSSCCGLVGIKPTYGRVSRHGTMGLSFSLDHIGPIARTVADCGLLLQHVAGRDPCDPTSSNRPVPDYTTDLEAGVRGLRIAVPNNHIYDPVTPEVRRVLEESLDILVRLGAKVVRVNIPSIEIANPLLMVILGVEAAALHAQWLRERPGDYGEQTRGRLIGGLMYSGTQYVQALNLRQKVLKAFTESVFQKADVLHAPVVPFPVPTIRESDVSTNPGFLEFLIEFGHCNRFANYIGLPAISVPAGFTPDGLPCGMQLIGRPYDEALLLRAARAYERETGLAERAPIAHLDCVRTPLH